MPDMQNRFPPPFYFPLQKRFTMITGRFVFLHKVALHHSQAMKNELFFFLKLNFFWSSHSSYHTQQDTDLCSTLTQPSGSCIKSGRFLLCLEHHRNQGLTSCARCKTSIQACNKCSCTSLGETAIIHINGFTLPELIRTSHLLKAKYMQGTNKNSSLSRGSAQL